MHSDPISDDVTPSNENEFCERLACFYREQLVENVLPFWLKHGLDDQYGGIFTCLERDGSLLDSDKGVWQQGRAAWLFARAYNTVDRNPKYLQAAKSIIGFLKKYGHDSDDGRMYFHVTRDGRPIRKRRYAFSEAFAAIAYAEYAVATNDESYLPLAMQCFEKYCSITTSPPPELAKFTGTRVRKSLAGPMICIITAQELRRVLGGEDFDRWIDWGIAQIRDYHWKPELNCLLETVAEDGTADLEHFDGWTVNPGHAIEGAWFILWEAQRRQSKELLQFGCQIIDAMWQLGWDNKYGGLLYFVGVHGKSTTEYWHDMKFWWPHNEAIIATLLAWRLTGAERYLAMHQQVHSWAFNHFADPEHGEWFGYLHRDGSLSSTLKGNLWKGPFHLPRMLMTCCEILGFERMSAKSLSGDQ